MNDFCKICNLPNPPENHFYRAHRIPIKQYFEENFPKKDLFTGTKLSFKNIKQYILTDFESRETMTGYFLNLSQKEKADYAREYLSRLKKIVLFAPSQVEYKSLICPPLTTISPLFDYYDYCKELGFINKFKNPKEYSNKEFDTTQKVIIDTREQRAFISFKNYELGKLNYGDYTLASNSKVAVERKSLQDFVASFSSGLERLVNEFERAQHNNGYIFILVEASFHQCLTFNQSSYFRRVSRNKMKITPDWIFHNVRNILQQFPNIQFIFCKHQFQIKSLMQHLIFQGDFLCQFDVELLYDTNYLIL